MTQPITDTKAARQAQQDVLQLRSKIEKLDENGLDLVFRTARSHHTWQDKPVSDEILRVLYDIAKWGGTANNGNPARYLFVKSPKMKDRLRPALAPGNVAKMDTAPVTVIIAYDITYFEQFGTLFPFRPEAADGFRSNPEKAEAAAFRNSSLQGAYLMMAARAIGLDIGPMSGFDNQKVDDAFFAGTPLRSNFLCNIGYADVSGLLERLPRFAFDDVCGIV